MRENRILRDSTSSLLGKLYSHYSMLQISGSSIILSARISTSLLTKLANFGSIRSIVWKNRNDFGRLKTCLKKERFFGIIKASPQEISYGRGRGRGTKRVDNALF